MEEFRRGGPKPINFKNNSTNILAQSQAKLLNFVKTGLNRSFFTYNTGYYVPIGLKI